MSVRKVLFLAIVSLGLVVCVTALCSQPATFLGHAGSGGWVASADGKTLVTVSKGGRTIRRWDMASRKEQGTFLGPTGIVRCMDLSPDGQILAWEGEARTIHLWDLSTGEELSILQGATAQVRHMLFSPDGKTITAAVDDKTIKLWDVTTGKERATLKGHTGFVYSVAFSPDSKALASGSSDNTVKLWDVITGKEQATFRGHRNAILCLAFSPEGRTLASGSWDYTVRVWDVASGKVRSLDTAWLGDDSAAYATNLAFSPEGRALAVLGTGDRIGVWDVASGKNKANFGVGCRPIDHTVRGVLLSLDMLPWGEYPYVSTLYFTSDGTLVALSPDDNTVTIREVAAIPITRRGFLCGVGVALLFLGAASGVRAMYRRALPRPVSPAVLASAVTSPLSRVCHTRACGLDAACDLAIRGALVAALLFMVLVVACAPKR
jgi:WD40 repeat protein